MLYTDIYTFTLLLIFRDEERHVGECTEYQRSTNNQSVYENAIARHSTRL